MVGTYSSLFIATPVFLWVNKRFYGGKGHLQWRAEAGADGEPARPVLAAEDGEIDESGRTAHEVRQADRDAADDHDRDHDHDGAAPDAEPSRVAVELDTNAGRDGDGGDDGPVPKASRRRRRRPQ